MSKWRETRSLLLGRIQAGELAPGDRLPPEPELSAQLNVSRATLREALRALAEEGYVTRKSGAGTRVASLSRLRNVLNSNYALADLIRTTGKEPGTRGLRIHVTPAGGEVADALGIDPEEEVVSIERVRTADEKPLVLASHYLPYSLANIEQVTNLRLLGRQSIYEVLAHRPETVVARGLAKVTPAKASGSIAEKLEIPKGSLLMHLWQVDYSESGIPVLLSSEYFLSDAFEFTILRSGPGAVAP